MIELLKEQKQAIINDAVTGKIDVRTGKPYPEYKDSGVEWLGKVPEGWSIQPLKHYAIIQNGITLGMKLNSKNLVKRPYLRVANVQNGYFNLSYIKEVELPAEDVHRYELREGDILITEGGDKDKLGRGFVWQGQIENCLHQNHIFAVRVNDSIMLPGYLTCLLNSRVGREYFWLTSKQTTNLASTNSTAVKAIVLPLPGIGVQQQILKYCNEKIKIPDQAIFRTEREISLMKEYRTRFIADVVTGKVDVRGIEVSDVPDEEAEVLEVNGEAEGLVEESDELGEAGDA